MTCGICHTNPTAGHTHKASDGKRFGPTCADCAKKHYPNGLFEIETRVTETEHYMPDPQETQVLVAREYTLSEQRLVQIQQFFPADQAGMDYAAMLAKQAKGEWKRIEAERVKITKPIRDGLEAVQNLFNPPLKNYAEMERILKERIVTCSQNMQRAQYEAAQAAQQAFQQGNMPALAVATTAIAASDVSTPQGVSFRVTWDFVIEDYSRIPSQFWVVNETAIRAAIVEAKGQIEIPGVKVIKIDGVALR